MGQYFNLLRDKVPRERLLEDNLPGDSLPTWVPRQRFWAGCLTMFAQECHESPTPQPTTSFRFPQHVGHDRDAQFSS